MSEYRDDLLDYCERRFCHDPGIARAQMMGHPGYKTTANGKFFLFVFEDGLALKLPPERVAPALEREDMAPFQPGGMPKQMGNWVVWTLPEAEDYDREWTDWVHSARDITASEPPNRRKR